MFKLHEGNVKISSLTLDNKECVENANIRGHVERAALLVRGSRYFNNAEFKDIEFRTAYFDDDEVKEKNQIGLYLSPVRGERVIYLDRVKFVDIKNGAVKCDRCTGNVTLSNVRLLEVFQEGGIFNATGNNFTLYDVNSVVTDAILNDCNQAPATPISKLTSEHRSTTFTVIISLLVLLIFSFVIELFHSTSLCCRHDSTDQKRRDHSSSSTDPGDYILLKPLLSTASSSSSSTTT